MEIQDGVIMPEKFKLKNLNDEENEKVRIIAKDAGYNTEKMVERILKKIDEYDPDFLDVGRFLYRGFTEKKIDKLLKLTTDEGLTKLKETNSFIKRTRLKPKKINDRISQFNRAVTSYGNGLKGIKKRKWDPETKSIEIPLEGGGKKLMTFKTEEEFNTWRQADIDNVSKHIEHDKGEVKDWSTIKKFKEALR